MMLLSEADYCISKIKMQVSGIEHASAIHHQLFSDKSFVTKTPIIGIEQVVNSGRSNNYQKSNTSSNALFITD